jgi:membrane fusion protein, multidrug efflux system
MESILYPKQSGILVFIVALFFFTNVFAADKVTPVSVVTAKKGIVNEEVPLTGSVVSIRTSLISPKVEGYIESLFIDEGDSVKKGDRIMYIDRQLADIEITRVNAQLNEARARVKEYKRQQAEAKELVAKKHIAATSYEATTAEVEINSAVVQRLEAELRRQQLISERHTLYAPFDGVITDKKVEVGQWIDTNTPLFELTEMNPLRIEVPVPQFYFGRINIGTPVKVKYDAIPDKLFDAQVTIKIPTSSQNTRTFPVMIKVNNDDQLIAPGMSARVIFQLPDSGVEQTILLPRDAIVQKPDGTKTVWLIEDKQGETRASPVIVITGKNHLDKIQIKTGDIDTGDQVVIKGNELLQPNQNVDVIEVLDYTL